MNIHAIAGLANRGAQTLTNGAGGRNTMQTILDAIGSKGGQTLVNAAGAGLSAYGASKGAAEDRELSARGMAQRQHESDRSHQLNQATSAAAASPLGAEQSFAQKQAIARALLGGARNFSVSPGDSAVAGAMGSVAGGMRLPEGGLDPAMLERLFGDEATLASLAQRAKTVGQINPAGPAMDLGPMFGDRGAATTQDVTAANSDVLRQQQEESARMREIIMRAIDEDIRGDRQPRRSGGSRVGGALSGAASGAAMGSAFGPVGTAVGGGLGFLKGLF